MKSFNLNPPFKSFELGNFFNRKVKVNAWEFHAFILFSFSVMVVICFRGRCLIAKLGRVENHEMRSKGDLRRVVRSRGEKWILENRVEA